MDNLAVHRTHCCKIHGCKYGDENCPVAMGQIQQDHPCEDCSYAKESFEEEILPHALMAFRKTYICLVDICKDNKMAEDIFIDKLKQEYFWENKWE